MKHRNVIIALFVMGVVALVASLISIGVQPEVLQNATLVFLVLGAALVGSAAFLSGLKDTIDLVGWWKGYPVIVSFSEAREKRLRATMLQRVRAFWIHGHLNNSLCGISPLRLELEHDPDAVIRPWPMTLEQPRRANRTIPPETRIIDIYRGLGGSMLILGEPGSGKTTTLLDLTLDLLNLAEENEELPIPVVLNLFSWSNRRQPLEDWLVQEINKLYGISQSHCKKWLQTEPLILLLDGLDEVKEIIRSDCVKEINTFHQEHGLTDIVVCSRTSDYEFLITKLRLPGAIVIKPLTFDQVDGFLAARGESMKTAREAVKTDAMLQELARTPLTLTIITIAYEGVSLIDLHSGTLRTIKESRNHLFKTYVQRMFEHRPINKYLLRDMFKGLKWLSIHLSRYSQTIFHIHSVQPRWLSKQEQRQHTVLNSLFNGLALGSLVWLASGYSFPWFLVGASFGVIRSVFFYLAETPIRIAAGQIKRTALNTLFVGALLGAIGFFAFWVAGTANYSLHIVALLSLAGGLFLGAVYGFGLAIYGGERMIDAGVIGLFIGCLTAPLAGILVGLLFFLIGVVFGWGPFTVLILGFIVGYLFRGERIVRHFSLRLVIHLHGYLPWRLGSFLSAMTERLILMRAGSGYVFVHRMLRDYFEELDLPQS